MTSIVEAIERETQAADAAVAFWTKKREGLAKLLNAARDIEGIQPSDEQNFRAGYEVAPKADPVAAAMTEPPVYIPPAQIEVTLTSEDLDRMKAAAAKPRPPAKRPTPVPATPETITAKKLSKFPSQQKVYVRAFEAYAERDKGKWIALSQISKRAKMSLGSCKSAIYGLIDKGLVVSNDKPTKSRRYRLAGSVSVSTIENKPQEAKKPAQVRLNVDTSVPARKVKQVSQESLRALIVDALEVEQYAEADLVTLLDSHREAVARACDTLSANGKIHRQSGKWALVPKKVTV